MKQIFVFLSILFSFVVLHAQQGELVDAGRTSFIIPLNENQGLVTPTRGFKEVFFVDDEKDEFTELILEGEGVRGYVWAQVLDSSQMIFYTHLSVTIRESRLFRINSEGNINRLPVPEYDLDYPPHIGMFYYSQFYKDSISWFTIKGSPYLKYYNLVRMTDDFEILSEDTLISKSNFPAQLGFTHFGAFNGTHFVFSGRNGSYINVPNISVYSLNVYTKEVEDLLEFPIGEHSRISNVVEHNGLFYFKRKSNAFSGFDARIYRSTGSKKGTELIGFGMYVDVGGADEMPPFMPDFDEGGNMWFLAKEDADCGYEIYRDDVQDHTITVYNKRIGFYPNYTMDFSGDSVAWIADEGMCGGSGEIHQVNHNTGVVQSYDSIANVYRIHGLNAQWSLVETKPEKSIFLVDKFTGNVHDFEPNHPLGETNPFDYFPNPHHKGYAAIFGKYVYYRLGTSLYRQLLPSPSSINQTVEENIQVYPNPCSTSIKILWPGNRGQFAWYSLAGKLLQQGQITESEMELVSPDVPGLYILELCKDNGDGCYREKVLVE